MSGKMNARPAAIGIVGLGLMGSSIVASLLAFKHPVKAVAPLRGEKEAGYKRILEQLLLCEKFDMLSDPFETYLALLTVSEDFDDLKDCELVVECIVEDISIKEVVFKKIAAVIPKDTIVASNTSAIPISILQKMVPDPQRFIGIHWAEPAFATRFLEIVCGNQTSEATADAVIALALSWGKEPTVLKKDIRGFITNRLMYAVYREILHLVEKGDTSFANADKCFRYDAGSWMTLMGIFRRMDYTGLRDCFTAYRNIFPLLSNSDDISPQMQTIADTRSRGIQNGKGFYSYTRDEAAQWSQAFSVFNKDIFRLAANYPEHLSGEEGEHT
ncbi:MAG: 3-hydroxyacyl-CoA dehydrogenase family protein [Chitinophagaceae bacterium]|jgi:3-hydroxybutyryl-CoA dehydrogenase|nr:3-hydroxyacyl-CoA dehydrogenase family protein [Chitinophagaceae bacterium]